MIDQQFDLIVIGAGTSGYMVASGAAKLGFKVALIEKSGSLGGLSLKTGCVATKTFINTANVAHKILSSKNIGLDVRLGHVDLRILNAHIDNVNSKLKHNISELELLKSGVKLMYGHAKFENETSLVLNSSRLRAKNFVIATGSQALIPNIKNINQINYLTHESVFELISLPAKLIVLGSNFHALEFAQAFSRLGSKVYVVERNEHILPSVDPQVSWEIRTALEQEGVVFFTGTTIQDCYIQKNKKFMVGVDAQGQSFTMFADEVLLDIGRCANVEGLGLANAKVKYTSDGILVDKRLRTSRKNIFAIGDVVLSSIRDNSVAQYEANVLLSNLFCNQNVKVNYANVPQAMHTSPAFAQVGLTEQVAIDLYKHELNKLKIVQFDFKDLDAANISGNTIGFVKLLLYKGKVVGVGIVGENAFDLIAEWSLAIKVNASLKDVANVFRAYPSMSIINKRVASATIYRDISSIKNYPIFQWFGKLFAQIAW